MTGLNSGPEYRPGFADGMRMPSTVAHPTLAIATSTGEATWILGGLKGFSSADGIRTISA